MQKLQSNRAHTVKYITAQPIQAVMDLPSETYTSERAGGQQDACPAVPRAAVDSLLPGLPRSRVDPWLLEPLLLLPAAGPHSDLALALTADVLLHAHDAYRARHLAPGCVMVRRLLRARLWETEVPRDLRLANAVYLCACVYVLVCVCVCVFALCLPVVFVFQSCVWHAPTCVCELCLPVCVIRGFLVFAPT